MISRGFIYVLLSSLFWAMDAVIAGYAFSKGSDVLVYCYQRACVSAILFFIYLQIVSKNSQKRKLKPKNILYLIGLGIISVGLGGYFGYQGVKYSVINYGFLVKSSIVVAPILDFLFFRKIITYRYLFFIGLLLFGEFLVSTKGNLVIPAKGDIYTIIAAFCYALTNVFSKFFVRKNSPEYMTFFRAIGGALVLFIIAYSSTEDLIQKNNLWFPIIGGFFGSLLFLFLYKALESTSATYVGMVGMSFSVFTAILSYFVLDQKFIPIQWLGASIIVLSVVLIEMKGSTIKLRRFWSIDKTIMIKK